MTEEEKSFFQFMQAVDRVNDYYDTDMKALHRRYASYGDIYTKLGRQLEIEEENINRISVERMKLLLMSAAGELGYNPKFKVAIVEHRMTYVPKNKSAERMLQRYADLCTEVELSKG